MSSIQKLVGRLRADELERITASKNLTISKFTGHKLVNPKEVEKLFNLEPFAPSTMPTLLKIIEIQSGALELARLELCLNGSGLGNPMETCVAIGSRIKSCEELAEEVMK